MARSSTIVDLLVFTTNAPFRGFARFTETVVPLACFETYALMCSARFLNACQDLHASMYTWLGGTVLSSSQGDPDAAGAAFFAAGFAFATVFFTGILAFVRDPVALSFIAGIAEQKGREGKRGTPR